MTLQRVESCSRERAKNVRDSCSHRMEEGKLRGGRIHWAIRPGKTVSVCQGTRNACVRDDSVPGGWEQVLKGSAGKFDLGLEDIGE